MLSFEDRRQILRITMPHQVSHGLVADIRVAAAQRLRSGPLKANDLSRRVPLRPLWQSHHPAAYRLGPRYDQIQRLQDCPLLPGPPALTQ